MCIRDSSEGHHGQRGKCAVAPFIVLSVLPCMTLTKVEGVDVELKPLENCERTSAGMRKAMASWGMSLCAPLCQS